MKMFIRISVLMMSFHSVALANEVQQSLSRVGYNRDLAAVEAQRLQASVPFDELLNQLIDASLNPTDHKTHSAANDIVCALSPFPFDPLRSRLQSEQDPYRKTTLLWFLDRGARTPEEEKEVIAQAKTHLYDQRPGLRIYGPASEYGTTRLRVCDEAYNILIVRLNMDKQLEWVSPTNSQFPTRNRNIDKLMTAIGLPVQQWQEFKPPEGVPAVLNRTKETKVPIEQKGASSTQAPSNDKATSSTQLSVFAVMIVAACGLLWLLLKRRS